MSARQDLVDELVAERHRPVPPPPGKFRTSQDHVDALQVDLGQAVAERDAARAEVARLRERIETLELRAEQHRCRPSLRSVS